MSTPLGELHFRPFFKDPKNITTHGNSNNALQNYLKRTTLFGGGEVPNLYGGTLLGTLGPLGVQMGAQTAKITKMTSKMTPGAPKSDPKRPTIHLKLCLKKT